VQRGQGREAAVVAARAGGVGVCSWGIPPRRGDGPL